MLQNEKNVLFNQKYLHVLPYNLLVNILQLEFYHY